MAERGSDNSAADARLTVSAVAINYNGGDRIVQTVRALLDQPFPLERIVVCDNASTDGTPARLRELFPTVHVHDMGGNDGLPKARNAGLAQVSTDLVLLVDNDVYVEDTTIARLVQTHLEWDRPAVVCPRVRLIPETDTVQAEGAENHFIGSMILRHAYRPEAALGDDPAEVGGCIGACYLLDRAQVMKVGGYDETFFFYHEDLEFAVRLRSLGLRFVAEPRAVVNHDRGVGTPGLSFRGSEEEYPTRRAYLSMRHRLLLIFIHYRWRTLLVLSPALLLYEVACLSVCVVRGWVGLWAKAWWWQASHLKLIREKRRRVQSARRRTDREVLTGGPLPVSPGFLRGGAAAVAFRGLSGVLDAYWKLTRRLIA